MDILADSLVVLPWWPWLGEASLRLALAAGLGAVIGFERGQHGRSAGFRTQLLVALGSALAMLVSLHFARQFGTWGNWPNLRLDPARVAYGVMGGIGFLGAGAIIRQGSGIRGLTTAASLWCTAAVGMACGFGMYAVALLTTLIVIFALVVLDWIEAVLPSRKPRIATVRFLPPEATATQRMRQVLRDRGARITDFQYDRDVAEGTEQITVSFSVSPRVPPEQITSALCELPNVCRVSLT